MPGPDGASWTSGAPKWAAVLVLGAASTAGIGWAIGRGGDPWRTPQHAQGQPMPIAATTTAPAMPVPVPAPTPIAPQSAPTPMADKPAEAPRAGAQLRKLINVNTAAQGELELLPGIGPALAKRILEYRASKGPFKRIDDLDAVKGIGPKILERIRPQVAVD